MKNKSSRKKCVRTNKITRKIYAGYNPNTSLPANIKDIGCEDIDRKITRKSHWNILNNASRIKIDLKRHPHIRQCIVQYNNDDVYIGHFDEHRYIKIGSGKMTFFNGKTYDGAWMNDKMNGYGMMKYPIGDTYNGNWKDNKKNGEGIMMYHTKDTYKGNWKNDKKNGEGMMMYHTGDTYDGKWKDDKKNGEGMMMYHTGYTYEGNWEDDKKNGKGIMYYGKDSEIDFYEGEWKNDEKHGKGKMVYKNEVKIEGEWKNDNMVNKSRKSTTETIK